VLRGEVMIVGRKDVTPKRGRPAATSQMVVGSAVKSSPKPPLTCKSMKPGASSRPAASRTVADGGRASPAAPTAAMRPSSMRTRLSSMVVAGVRRVAWRMASMGVGG